jgi:hypothetical protein
MKKLWTIFAYALVSTSFYIISMEQNIITSDTTPTVLTKEQIKLTEELYRASLSTEQLEELHQKGAQLNHTPKSEVVRPLCYQTLKFTAAMPYPRTSIRYSTNKDNYMALYVLRNITKLLELGAKPMHIFSENYFFLLDYCMLNQHDNELKTLLKYKPTRIYYDQLKNIWKYTLTKETHQYIDFLVQYFTPDELESGLDYCVNNCNDIIKEFHDYETYLPGIVQKLIAHGANPDNVLLGQLTSNITHSWEKNTILKKLNLFCDNRAFGEITIDILEKSLENTGYDKTLFLYILEEHLKDIEDEKALCLSIINTMKKNKDK